MMRIATVIIRLEGSAGTSVVDRRGLAAEVAQLAELVPATTVAILPGRPASSYRDRSHAIG
jgi:hypothetical protein